MEIKEDIVIVGAGIAGLATALALKRVGVHSLVLERSHTLRASGAAIMLFENAWVALHAVGIADRLKTAYTPFRKEYVTDVTSETCREVILTGKNGDMDGPRAVHMSALMKALVEELPAGTVRCSSKLKSIEKLTIGASSSATTLRLEDGTIIKAKVVIGCDGVHSVVGRWLGLQDPIHSGRLAVRGLAVFPQGHGLTHEIHQYLEGRTKAGVVPLNDKEVYWFSVFTEDEDMSRKSPEMIQKKVLKNMAELPQVFLDAVHHSCLSTLTCAPVMFRVPWDLLQTDMYKYSITVAGDAMHPMTSDLTQGGCSALEDAVVLGRHIGNSYMLHGTVDSRALEGYVKERRWRAALLITASYFSGWVQQGGTGWLNEFLRDKVGYKFFAHLTGIVVNYDCGHLPGVCMKSGEYITNKKLL